jgi:hypothetical protein
MIIKCEFCDDEFDNPYEFAEHLEYHIYSIRADEQEKENAKANVIVPKEKVKAKPQVVKPKKYITGRGHKMSPVITSLIERNSNKSPLEIKELILKKEGLDVPVQSIYYVRNYNKKKNKGKEKSFPVENLDSHTEISEEEFLNGENGELPQSVVQILRTYEDESPSELSERIKSSLGVLVTPKAILEWKDKN